MRSRVFMYTLLTIMMMVIPYVYKISYDTYLICAIIIIVHFIDGILDHLSKEDNKKKDDKQ